MYRHAYTFKTMSPKEPTAFRIDTGLLNAMRTVKEREGIPVTVQIEKAVREWLERRGAINRAERKRPTTRKRP
jgi:hypothetical protein